MTRNSEIEKFLGQILTNIKGLGQVTSFAFGMGESSECHRKPLATPSPNLLTPTPTGFFLNEREISLSVDRKAFGVLLRSVSYQNQFKILSCTKSTAQIFSIFG